MQLDPQDRLKRGYIEVVDETRNRSNVVDPVHSIWKLAIRTVSNLLHVGDGSLASESTVDFLCLYGDALITGCLVAGTRYSGSGLSEMSAILELLNAVCGDEDVSKKFQSCGGGLYLRLLNKAMEVSRDVCTFLGSSTIAREVLGSAAASPNKKPDRSMEYNISEINSHAHGCQGCVAPMTKEDKELLNGPSDKKVDRKKKVDKKGAKTYDSDFGRKMEMLASRCLFFAVSAVSRAHPATKSFVTFSPQESSTLNVKGAVENGTRVAVRQDVFGGIGESPRFAKIVKIDDSGLYIDVKYFDDNSVERNVSASRIAGIQDKGGRKPLVKLSFREDAFSIEHMGFALKWAKLIYTEMSGGLYGGLRDCGDDECGISGLEARALIELTERLVVLMACELNLGRDANMLDYEGDMMADLGKLICELFDVAGDGSLRGTMKVLLDDEIWRFVHDSLDVFFKEGEKQIVEIAEGRGRGRSYSYNKPRKNSSGGAGGK